MTSTGAMASPTRQQFKHFLPITTRWSDNDIYGHVNNVTYYSYFDSVANQYLIEQAGLDIHNGDEIALVVNSSCDYFQPAAFPEQLQGGLRVNRLGNSSVQYGIAIFQQGEDKALAAGTFTHVFVDRTTRTPKAIEGNFRTALAAILSTVEVVDS